MKKIITKLICLTLALCMVCSSLVACSDKTEWKKGDLTILPNGAGSVIENGGFVSETENYVYFINGNAENTEDNTLGTPVKGALMVAKKSDLSKAEIVVPKLFVANDMTAGVLVDGEYVYYATPSVEKNSQGAVANNEMTFARTKLDGSGETDTYFTLNDIAYQYRLVKGANGNVCAYYYEAESAAIMCYCFNDKTSTEVIKTDIKNDTYSLEAYKFLEGTGSNGIIAVVTATVYKDAYDEALAENANYSRITESYNKLFVIKAGEKALTEIASGKNAQSETKNVKYAVTHLTNDYLFITETTATNVSTQKAVAIKDVFSFENAQKTTIVNQDYVASTSVIVGLDEVYVIDSNVGKVYKTTLTQLDNNVKTPIAISTEISTLLFKNGNYLYFYNTEYIISRINLENNEIEVVSENTTSTVWFRPEIKTINEKDYMFYLDNSRASQTYVKAINLTDANVVEKEEKHDGHSHKGKYLESQIFEMGKKNNADLADTISYLIESVEEALPKGGLTATEEDKEFEEALLKAETAYNNAKDAVKELVSSSLVEKIGLYKKAIAIAKEYKVLEGIQACHSKAQADEQFKGKYEQVKDSIGEFKKSEKRDLIDSYVSDNLKAYYTLAIKWFVTEAK